MEDESDEFSVVRQRRKAVRKKKKLEEKLATMPLGLTSDKVKQSGYIKDIEDLTLEIHVCDTDLAQMKKDIDYSRQSVINSELPEYKSEQNKARQQKINTKRKVDEKKRKLDDEKAMCEQRKANQQSHNTVLTKQSPREKRQEQKRDEQEKLLHERQAKNNDRKRLVSAEKHSRGHFMKRLFQIFISGYRNEKKISDERVQTVHKQRMTTVTRGYFQEWKLVHGDKPKNIRIAQRFMGYMEIFKKRRNFTFWKNIVEEIKLMIPYLIVVANEQFAQRVFETFIRRCRDSRVVTLEQIETLQLKRDRAILKGYFHELRINYMSSHIEFTKSGQEFFSIWKHFKTHTFMCVICCDEKDLRKTTFSQLECKHTFCTDCIADMYPTSRQCPHCRKNINELPEPKRFNEKSRKMVSVDIELEKNIISSQICLKWEKIIEHRKTHGHIDLCRRYSGLYSSELILGFIYMYPYILDHPYCITEEYTLECKQWSKERAEDELHKHYQIERERRRREYLTVQNYTIEEFTQNDGNDLPMYTPDEISIVRGLLSINPEHTDNDLMMHNIMCPRVRLLENIQREQFSHRQSQQ